jgi:hypothetical protein
LLHNLIGLMGVIPDFRSDKELLALHNRRNDFLECTTNLVLIFINGSEIEVAITVSNSDLNLKYHGGVRLKTGCMRV